MSDGYGGSVDRLPRSMVKVVRAPADDSRLLMWVGRSGVHLMDLAEHQQSDRASIQRFPQNGDSSIAWASVPSALMIRSGRDDELAIADYLREEGDVVIMWSTLALPSVLLSAAEASARIPEIMATVPLLWLYRPDRDLVLERNYFDDTVTVARIPQS
ncbi:hypothetical protein [Actinoplanes palleronii]|uniref:Uncharacterized protein n=1 Tax=Actinoplanes palleronii TaxID=113570 RepID=A0ABQ4BS40_9ACTN|nr:hypothetical protein [Actinoplanes palleronii]GIE73509.1 hypothetical protein Apa02nite_096170 [Actinoplanes palleronii]